MYSINEVVACIRAVEVVLIVITLVACIIHYNKIEREYKEAVQYFDDGNYENAIEIFEKLDDCGDSGSLLKESNTFWLLNYTMTVIIERQSAYLDSQVTTVTARIIWKRFCMMILQNRQTQQKMNNVMGLVMHQSHFKFRSSQGGMQYEDYCKEVV